MAAEPANVKLVTGVDDTRLRENEFVELLVETGATEHVCGLRDFTHAALTSGPRPVLKTALGEPFTHYGQRTVDFWCQGEARPFSSAMSNRCSDVAGTCG